ncbi:putative histone-lysine N-methyltransferase PRDM6 [Stylophora pistillata]|uniref:putative histone-lysine N-methyltransferase PRDM6 n=1 Tax=Stylophora pistillata TaxID=50429 RepID=UPI000C03D0B7|nr:putative histone-lysine N-methyltransferase PRDM6 [Stylophora pistillata]
MHKAGVLKRVDAQKTATNLAREAMSKVQPLTERKPEGPGSKRPPFTWEEICMYLYGHTPMEPAITEDQRKNVKREENGPERKKKRCSLPSPSMMFPDEVKLCKSSVPGAEFGVCAAQPIPPGTWIGPYEGQVVRCDELREGVHNSYMWENCGAASYLVVAFMQSLKTVIILISILEHTVQWKPPGIEEESFFEDIRDQEFDDHERPLDPFGLGLKDHGEPHIWRCGQCTQTFSQRVLLQMHVCPQSPDRPYQCGHCPSSFPGPAELREHVVIHINEKPFKCGFCGRSFAGATTLNNHIRTHTGEKPFKCEKCHMTFSQSTQLSRHQKSPEECQGDPKERK